MGSLLGEELFLNVFEGFDLDGVAAGIQEEHGALFAGLAFESYVGLYDKWNARFTQLCFKDVEVEKIEDGAEMRDRNAVTVDDAGDFVLRASWILVGEVTDELVAEEIKIHPLPGAAPFVTAQQVAIELPRLVEIANPDRQVKRRKAIHGFSSPRVVLPVAPPAALRRQGVPLQSALPRSPCRRHRD